MYRNSVPSRQIATWLCAALIPTLLQLEAGIGWLMAVIVTGLCSGVLIAVWVWGKPLKHPVLAGIQYLYIIVLLCTLLPYAALSWPGDNYPAVPLILLALAAWSANKGADAAARVGCVLFWLVLLIYLPVLASGTSGMKFRWLRPTFSADPWMAVALLLIPCVTLILRKEERGWSPRLLLSGIFLIAGAAVSAGILSPEIAKTLPDPFYTAVRSLNVLGIAQRFEAILSAGMTVGWFSLFGVLLSSAAGYAECIKPQRGKMGLWTAAVLSALGMLCNLHITL